MAYTAKDATNTLLGYLNVPMDQVDYIPDTNKRGFIYDLPSGEKCAIFIYPISHKADGSKNFFDTRDSGATERSVTWNYACEHGIKYFCLAVQDKVDKYRDYIFSLECDEKIVAEVSGMINGERRQGGTQVVIPNNYVPDKQFDRIRTRNNFWMAVIRKDNLIDYLEKFDSRPYLNTDNKVKVDEEDIPDEYHRAAEVITEHINETGLTLGDKKDEAFAVRTELLERFSPEKLSALSDNELLSTLFYTVNSDNSSLCYFLEFNKGSRDLFGSISGGSSYKFILFQNKEDGKWTTGSPTKPVKLTDSEALALGKTIRNYLVKGAEIIKDADLNTPQDYEDLDVRLNEVTDGKCTFAWIHKYYSMLFPEKLTPFHSYDWQRHILYSLRIRPSSTYYGRDGQITIVRKLAGLDYTSFFDAFSDRFGDIRKFIRIGTTDNEGNHYAEELRNDNSVGIGWNKIGPLSDYITGNRINRPALTEALVDNYYSDQSKANVASRKAGELATFYNAGSNSVFVAMDGERLLGLVDEIGNNYFDNEKTFGHRRSGKWHLCFGNEDSLPNQSEGHLTSCYELKDEDNMMYLYEKYYYRSEEDGDEEMNLDKPFTEPVYNTGLSTKYSMNRIIFGAPGTGKSYQLEQERKDILKEDDNDPKKHIGDYERVTFHPDYTYSQFVGTYKPVSEGRDIYYKFVPGPFMRVYVKAIRNGIDTKNGADPEPFVLLIEEINRAPVAAVFGDVFQLLDRDDEGTSQYEIEASEDIRRYLSDELGGNPDNYEKIKLPDNMFIWATMNSADQGVFPMDTAFKRRWEFKYLGVDENEDKLPDGEVLVGNPQKVQQKIKWNNLRRAINKWLSDRKVNEDKLLGPFFISKNVFSGDEESISKRFSETFKNKVLMYLFEDAARQKRPEIFSGAALDDGRGGKKVVNTNRYSEICKAFDEQGIGIFNSDIQTWTDAEDTFIEGHKLDQNGVPIS